MNPYPPAHVRGPKRQRGPSVSFPIELYFTLDGLAFFVVVFFGFFLSFFLSLFPMLNLLPHLSVLRSPALPRTDPRRAGRRGIRTPDLLGVNQSLYPAELAALQWNE